MALESNGVFLEFYDDQIDLVEVSDTEYLEIYDGSFGTPTVLPSESATFTHGGVLQVGFGTSGYPIAGGTFTILSVAAMVTSPSSGASVIIDVNKNGTSIYGNQAFRPTIAPGQNIASVGTHTVSQVQTGDYLTIDIDQVGSVNPGSFLTVSIRLQRIA